MIRFLQCSTLYHKKKYGKKRMVFRRDTQHNNYNSLLISSEVSNPHMLMFQIPNYLKEGTTIFNCTDIIAHGLSNVFNMKILD